MARAVSGGTVDDRETRRLIDVSPLAQIQLRAVGRPYPPSPNEKRTKSTSPSSSYVLPSLPLLPLSLITTLKSLPAPQIHILCSLLLDFQPLYPPSLVPSPINLLPELYISFTRDPIVGGVMGAFGEEFKEGMFWLRNFMWVEMLFQFPVFLVGAWGLWKGTWRPPHCSLSIFP